MTLADWHLGRGSWNRPAQHPEQGEVAQPLVALVHLSDWVCRMCAMGYGYYERHKVDLAADPAWSILMKEQRELAKVDIALFSFELDEAVNEVFALVSTIFGASKQRT